MKMAVLLYQPEINAEERRKMPSRKDLLFRPICQNPALPQKNHALDFRNDLRNVVSHQKNANPTLRPLTNRIPKLNLRGDVQRVAGLVEQQRSRVMHQRPRDQGSLGFARRHLGDRTSREMRDSQTGERGHGSRQMRWIRMMVRKDAPAAKKTGKHNVATSGVRRGRSEQVRRDDSKQRTQLKDVPALASQNRNRGAFPDQGITLPRDRFDQSGFAAAVGSEDADVFAGSDAKSDSIESRPIRGCSAHHSDIVQGQERRDRLGLGQDGNYINREEG